GHAERGRLHLRLVVRILALALGRPVEDVLAEVLGALHVHHLGLLAESRHLTFLAPRIVGAAHARRPVTGEAAERYREALAAHGGRGTGEAGGGSRGAGAAPGGRPAGGGGGGGSLGEEDPGAPEGPPGWRDRGARAGVAPPLLHPPHEGRHDSAGPPRAGRL